MSSGAKFQCATLQLILSIFVGCEKKIEMVVLHDESSSNITTLVRWTQ